MKKIIALTMITAMLAFSGCGSDEKAAPAETPKIEVNDAAKGTTPKTTSSPEQKKEAEAKLDGVTTEKITEMADEIKAAQEAGDKEKERQLLDEMQEYLEAIEALEPAN